MLPGSGKWVASLHSGVWCGVDTGEWATVRVRVRVGMNDGLFRHKGRRDPEAPSSSRLFTFAEPNKYIKSFLFCKSFGDEIWQISDLVVLMCIYLHIPHLYSELRMIGSLQIYIYIHTYVYIHVHVYIYIHIFLLLNLY